MKKLLYILFIILPIAAFPQWTVLPSGTNADLCSVCFTDSNTGYVVGLSGTILKTTNGGTTWSPLSSGTDYRLASVDFPDANHGYVAGQTGTLFKTSNAGLTWTDVSIGISPYYSVSFADSSIGCVVGSESYGYAGLIDKTINAGSNWTPVFYSSEYVLNSVYFINANTGYAVGGSGTILQTSDGGTTWMADIVTGTNKELESVYFPDENTGYAVGNYGTIVKTSDAGNTWTALSSGTPQLLRSVFFPDANTGYAVGNYGNILKTIDGGTTWITLSSGNPYPLYAVYFTDVNTGYAVGEHGTILKTSNGGTNNIEETKAKSTFYFYPNPATDKITIKASSIPTHTKLSIVNPSGQQLITRQITESKNIIDISNLPSGVYFVRVTSDKTVEVGKFVKQ